VTDVGFRFFAVPGHQLVPADATHSSPELFEPKLPPTGEIVEHALSGAEFRDMRARDRLRSLLSPDQPSKHGAPAKGFGPSAVFAQPPTDLPALLRMADQLEMLARSQEGEKALVWKCQECQTRYAVPVSLVRHVAIRCERCGTPVELHAGKSLGEESLLDPFQGSINEVRRELAVFFREAMARGWPVLVSSQG
jgi:hypothetical protein